MEYQEVDEFVSKKPKLHLDAPALVDESQIKKLQNSVESNDDSGVATSPEGVVHKSGEEKHNKENETGDHKVLDTTEDETPKEMTAEEELESLERLRKAVTSDIRHMSISEFLEKYDIELLPWVMKVLNINIDDMEFDDMIITLSKIIESQKRHKRSDINTLEQAVDLIQNAKNIVVVTGAGVSVSCGIPDFRSKNGVYSRLDEFELEDPQQMFDIHYFKYKPQTFYTFAKEIYPTNFKPSPSHAFIKLLESKGKLLRNYTQNIDTLEQLAGISNIVQCHGSFAMAKCTECDYRISCKEIEPEIFAQKVPLCPKCYEEKGGIIKPEITFFGEKLPQLFDDSIKDDAQKVDLLIVIGSSLKVSPVADVKDIIPHDVPQILINLESLPHMQHFDIHLLGYCDIVVAELSRMLGWDLQHEKIVGGSTAKPLPEEFYETVVDPETGKSERVRKRYFKKSIEPHKYYFEGSLGSEDMHPNSYVPSGQEDSSASSESDSESESSSDSDDTDDSERSFVGSQLGDDIPAQQEAPTLNHH